MEYQTTSTFSSVQFCMICLDTRKDCKLHPVNKYNLDLEFEKLTGIFLRGEMQFAPHFCSECAQRVVSSNRFRDKCLRAYCLLVELVDQHGTLTTQNINRVDREKSRIASNLTKKVFPPNYCNLHLTEIKVHHDDRKNHPRVKQEVIVFEESVLDVKFEVEPNVLDVYDTVDISKDDSDNEPMAKNDVFKNELNCLDYDIDVDIDCDDNDYDYDIDCDAMPQPDTNEDRKNITNNDGTNRINTNDVIGVKSETQVCVKIESVKGNSTNKGDTRAVKKKSVKEGDTRAAKRKSTNEGSVRDSVGGKVRKRVRNNAGCSTGVRRLVKPREELKLFKVIEMTQEQQIAEIQKRKQSDNYKDSAYRCDICYKGFTNSETYSLHIDRHTDKCGQFECDVCRIRFNRKYKVTKHMSNHAVLYKCTRCQFTSTHRTAAIQHERWHDGKTYKCPHCGDMFSKNTTFFSHMRIKHPSDFVCCQCGFSFIGERGLQMHMAKKHRSVGDTQKLDGPLCETCNIRFASEAAYKQHTESSPRHAPAGERKPNCHKSKRVLRRVSRRVRKRMPTDCEQCGAKFDSFRQYSIHFKSEHQDMIPKKTAANYMCETCGKVLLSPMMLREHMQVHTGRRMYKCDQCGARFMSKASVRAHIYGHSHQLACRVCDKSFSSVGNLARHMKSHEPARPYYKCECCGKSYTTLAGRDLHVAHVHQFVPWPKRVRGKRRRVTARRRSVQSAQSDSEH